MGDKLKKSGKRSVVFAILLVLLLVSMAGFVNAEILINEFLPNSVDTNYEWIELYNNGSSAVNLSNYNVSEEAAAKNFTIGDVTIAASSFVVLVRNESVFNLTHNITSTLVEYGASVPSLNLNDSGDSIFLYNASGNLTDSILNYGDPGENTSVGRFPDGSSNIVNLSVRTPGSKNDNAAPVFNKWTTPSSNSSLAQTSLNITVNITDVTTTVNTSLVNFNGTNFSMTKTGDLWYYLWNISKNIDKIHNITVHFNDSNGLASSDTIFNITAGHAPDFNKWTNPSKNNTYVGGLFNLTVNITDAASTVNTSIVNFNGTNFSMSKSGDLWYYVWNTSKNSEIAFNINVTFNDSNGFKSNDTSLFDITVDNTFPNITSPNTTANSRNFVSPGFIFNASVNATDTNLLNVTCLLNGITKTFFANISNTTFICNLTAPTTEGDFEINITAIDKAGNKNSTTINITTKHSTAGKLLPLDVTVSDLNQSSKTIQVNVTLNNTGSNPMYDAGIIIDSFSTDKLSATSVSYQSCSLSINSSQSCNATFNITIAGGATGSHDILWNANWTDNNLTVQKFSQVVSSTVTLNNNPQLTAPKNDSATISHGQNSTLTLHINSTGNAALSDVNITFVQGTLLSDWIANITHKKFSSISAAVNKTFNVTVAIPKYTNPRNYTGTINITASGLAHNTIELRIEVPTDNSWKLNPNVTTTYKKSSVAGNAGIFTINNTGNIGQNFTFYPPTGDLFKYIWNDSNEQSVYVEAGQTREVSTFHKPMNLGPVSLFSFNLSITVQSQNTSLSNTTFINLTKDDNNPFVNITAPINNSFVKGDVEFNVTATDLNLSRLEYFINNSLVFNSTDINFTFNWSTNNGSYGDEIYELKVIAFDSSGNSNTSIIQNITVNNSDSLPILRGNISTINITEDNDSTILNLSLFFVSIDGDTLKYNFTQPDNITVHVNNETQIANFTPAANFTGLNYIIFTANDTSSNMTSSNNITLRVVNVNDAPTTPKLVNPEDGSNVTSSVGRAILSWNASIEADNDPVTYYVFLSNDSSKITLNATTTTINLQLIDLVANETYFWHVIASDDSLNSSNSSTFNFTVIRDSDPVINKWTWNNTINISSTNTTPFVAENKTLSFIINASDPDNNSINFTWFINSVNVSYVQNFTFNLTNNFTATGSYALKLQVQDNNSNSVEQEWTVTVTNTNREPNLDDIRNQSVVEDSVLKFNITAVDPENDSITFTSNISAISFTKKANNSLAEVSWTPTNDDVGNNTITFLVNDSTKTDSFTIIITVNNTNDAPTITSFLPTQNKTIAANAGSQRFDVTFTDVDVGDKINATWFRNGTVLVRNSSNVTVTNLAVGIYNITVIVNDTSAVEARYEWKLDATTAIIGDGLASPILINLNQSQRENVTNVTINQSAFGGIDFGNKKMNFSKVANLEDAVNISSGLISIDTETYPELNKNASILMKGLNFTKAPLIYNASGFESTAGGDVCPATVCTNVTYDIANGILRFNVPHFSTYFTQTNQTNGAPVITSTPVTGATENAKYTYDVDATDPDGDTLIFSLITNPSGMSISSTYGLISWTPTIAQLGLNNVTVNVSDSNLTVLQSFNISVGKGPKMIISDLDVKVDGKTDKNINNNTKIGKDASPGAKVEFKLEIESLFTNDEDLEIEDIDVEITIEDIDDGDDLEEDADEFDLKQGKDERVNIKFEIPLEVDEDIFDVIIDVEGEDENGTTHTIRWELELEVEKENHEIRIIRSALTPSTVACQRRISINTEVINTGSSDEDDVSLEIVSPELDISSLTNSIVLDEGTDDNRYSKLITETLSSDVLPGTYPIEVNSYYDGKLSETKTLNLVVEECELVKKVKKDVKEKKPEVEVIIPKIIAKKEPVAKVTFAQTDEYKTLLAILLILFLGTAIFVVGAGFILLKKK